MSTRETFHIEILGGAEGAETDGDAVQQRLTVRTEALEQATERALRLFARARAPQRVGELAEAVRVIDGAGTELFRWSRFDEPREA